MKLKFNCFFKYDKYDNNRSSHPGVFLGEGVLKATLLKSHFGMGVPL